MRPRLYFIPQPNLLLSSTSASSACGACYLHCVEAKDDGKGKGHTQGPHRAQAGVTQHSFRPGACANLISSCHASMALQESRGRSDWVLPDEPQALTVRTVLGLGSRMSESRRSKTSLYFPREGVMALALMPKGIPWPRRLCQSPKSGRARAPCLILPSPSSHKELSRAGVFSTWKFETVKDTVPDEFLKCTHPRSTEESLGIRPRICFSLSAGA